MTWHVERIVGPAAGLHGRPLPEPPRRLVSVLLVDRPALVLGSTQPAADVDDGALAAAGTDLVRRRSGGGAVLLEPGESLWIDLALPAGDPLWDDDVGRSFHWLGRVWVAALDDLGVPAEVHTGAMRGGRWSRLVCFGGLGPGEVVVGGRKLVGISQRRTRAVARFQCVVHRRWDPGPLLGLLALDPADRAEAGGLADLAVGLDRPFDEVIGAFVRHLPDESG